MNRTALCALVSPLLALLVPVLPALSVVVPAATGQAAARPLMAAQLPGDLPGVPPGGESAAEANGPADDASGSHEAGSREAREAGPGEAGPVRDANTEVELLAEHESVRPGEAVHLGLRMAMDAGWHSYWHNPGATGMSTRFDWTLPEGFEAGEIQWPHPERFEFEGLISYGYGGEVLLPVRFEVPEVIDAERVTLAVDVEWLSCEAICIPGDASLALELPVSAAEPTVNDDAAELFEQARQRLPAVPAVERGEHVEAQDEGEQLVLRTRELIDAESEVVDAYFYVSDPSTLDYDAEQLVHREGAALALVLTPSALRTSGDGPIERLRGVLVIETEARTRAVAVDTAVVELAAGAEGGETSGGITLWHALVGALVGGLLLNLMPCVFPVLSLKALGFVKQAGQSGLTVRLHGLSFAAGVLVLFWVLAAVVVGLRAADVAVGWGFHLQSPVFVAAMAMLTFAVGLSLVGVFDIGVGLMNLAGRAESQLDHGTYTGSFCIGGLATVLATPCTAPFMGPAIGFAFTRPPTEIVLVLTALGAGMALPWVGLAFFPAFVRWLPRPGAWMETFKQAMGFPMFATTIWLVWVFTNQRGDSYAMMLLLFGLLLVAVAGWMFGRWGTPRHSAAVRWAVRGAAVALVVLGVVAPATLAPASDGGTEASMRGAGNGSLDWEPYSDQRVAELTEAGRIVFVDFTADWCVTCKVNENRVLETQPMREAFAVHDVALLKADWTRRDEHITAALARFDRASVPLYVVHRPASANAADGEAEPIVLPTILTHNMVIDAIAEAAETAPRAEDGDGRTAETGVQTHMDQAAAASR